MNVIRSFFQLCAVHSDFVAMKCQAISSVLLTGGHLFQGIHQHLLRCAYSLSCRELGEKSVTSLMSVR